jgi:hypothetical protein
MFIFSGHKENANQNHTKHHQQHVFVKMWGKRIPHTLLVGMQAGATTLEKIWRLLKNLNIGLPYDPAILLLGINPKECNTGYSRGTYTPMFIAALFTITKLWKQPRCSTTDECINKMWCLYTMEFYSAMKKYEILSFAGKWIDLENIILVSSARLRRPNIIMFSLICRL